MRTGSDALPAKLVILGAAVVTIATTLEVLRPVFTLGPLAFTTTELAVGFFILTVVVWGISRGRELLQRRALDLAVAVFLASNYLSAVFSEERPSALKFSLRLTYGALVYFGISRLPRRYRPHLFVAGTVAAVAVAVSLVGVTENFLLSLLKTALSPFRERVITFGAYYNVRVSSTFPFPTIYAFYLEMLTPVVLTFGLWLLSTAGNLKRRRLLLAATLACVFVPLAAIAYTYTRSAFLAAPATLLIGSALALLFGLGRRVYLSFAAAAVFFVMLVAVSAVFSNTMAFRLGLAEQEQRFDAEYSLTRITQSFAPGEPITAEVHVTNQGSETWEGPEGEPALLIYRWLSYPEMVKQDVELVVAPIPHEVRPGQSADITAEVMTPQRQGKYVLVFELFIDSPFSHSAVEPLAVPVDLKQTGLSTFEIPEAPSTFFDREPAPMSTPRRLLWRASLEAWKDNPILGLGPDQFRKRYVEYIPGVELDPRLGAHNIFLDAMANTGLVGLAALIYLLASVILLLVKLARERTGACDVRLISLGLLISMIAYVGHGMLEYPLWQTGVMLMWFILMGVASILQDEAASNRERRLNRRLS